MPPNPPPEGTAYFTRRPSRKARSLTPLAGLLGVILITNALLGVFGLHYAHKGTVANFHELSALMVDLDMARQARGYFKVQVQEWKNVLLRHDEPGGLDRYWDAFRSQEDETRRTLGELIRRIGARGDDPTPIQTILSKHTELGKAYRAALLLGETEKRPGPDGDSEVFNFHAADRSVRGQDRALDGALDNLALKVHAHAEARQREMIAEGQERYETLRTTATWGLAGCILLVGLFLALAIRGERGRR